MNRKLVFKYLGKIICALGAFLVLPIITALIYREWKCLIIFCAVAVLSLVTGTLMQKLIKPENTLLYAKEGLAITALAWVVMSIIGALPFTISGEIPSYIDALFETVSGFTTTGATIISDVESMSRSILMWRSFTHWVGGMGVLVFMLAILPNLSDRSVHIMRAEMPGPIFGKLVPRSKDTAKILYLIYIVMTVAMVIFLLAGKMPLYDSIVHALGTAGTGGFGIKGDSIASYSPYIQWVITVFMILFGVNFNLYYYFIIKRSFAAFKSTELFVYLAIIAVSSAAIFINIARLFDSISDGIRHAVFQVASIISTTGFATVDFNLWPDFSKALIFCLIFVGGCAGSTAGGLKIARLILVTKIISTEFRRLAHPRSVTSVRFEGKTVADSTINSVTIYLSVFAACYAVAFLIISLEPHGFITNFTAIATCINNVGPGLDKVGPSGNFSIYNGFSTFVLTFTMLLGRLEIFPLLLTCLPGTWKKG